MPSTDCPPWEYAAHPRRKEVIGRQLKSILIDLRSHRTDTLAAQDTRFCHESLFRELTPANFEYYAGHYRGEPYPCLKFANVTVPGDPRVGAPAEEVLAGMYRLGASIDRNLKVLDRAAAPRLAARERLKYVVAIACRVLERFLRIHPYLNGNGHMGRLIVWMILGRYGYWPMRFTIEPRPPDPPYTRLIEMYRSGNKEPLERFVIASLAQSS